MMENVFLFIIFVQINFENNSLCMERFLRAFGKNKTINYPEKGYSQTTHKVVRFFLWFNYISLKLDFTIVNNMF